MKLSARYLTLITQSVVIALTTLHGTSFAQGMKCDVELSGSPAVRGFKLGMTRDKAGAGFKP
jgi:hypothetical protein